MSLAIRDALTPALLKAARGIADRKPILEAMGLQMVSITKRAFSDPSLRPMPWAPRKDTKPHSLLRKSGALWQSIRVGELTNDHVDIRSDRVYAAAQQLGYAPRNLPPRPFFPIINGDLTPVAADKIQRVAVAKIKAIIGAT